MSASSPSDPTRPTGRAPKPGRLLTTLTPLVDALPDLVDGLAPARAEQARHAVRARVLAVRRGRWAAAADAHDAGAVGFLVTEGTLLRRVVAGHREGAELLGPGDLIQPAAEGGDEVSWRAVTDAALAILDTRVLLDAGSAPEVTAALLGAATSRTNTVARQLVVAQWSSVDDRLVATLGMLSERWGVVTRDGVVLPDFLTHSVLAPLVGARRPSVTTALKRLAVTGAVRRAPDGRWIVAHREP